MIRDWRLCRELAPTIRGYFDLSRLSKGGTRPTHAQQKLDAVFEAITPHDAGEKRLLRALTWLVELADKSGTSTRLVSDAAERRRKQEEAGHLFNHRRRELRHDFLDLACARRFWHNREDVRLNTFAGRVDKKVKYLDIEVDANGNRSLVVKTEYHQAHTQHADIREINGKFLQSADYAEFRKGYPSRNIGVEKFRQAKCSCIEEPHARECADQVKTTQRELLVALG